MQQTKAHTEQNKALAMYALLHDLHHFGVTDALGPTPGQLALLKPQVLASAPAEQKVVAPKPQKTKTAPKTVQKELPSYTNPSTLDEKIDFDPQNCVAFHQGDLPFIVAVAGETSTPPMGDGPQKQLWENMLKAIGFDGTQVPSYLVFYGQAGLGGLPPQGQKALKTHAVKVLEKSNTAAKALFFVGEQALKNLIDAKTNPADIRVGSQDLNINGTTTPLCMTYNLQALLRQPLLKRQAWADLLQLKGALDGA